MRRAIRAGGDAGPPQSSSGRRWCRLRVKNGRRLRDQPATRWIWAVHRTICREYGLRCGDYSLYSPQWTRRICSLSISAATGRPSAGATSVSPPSEVPMRHRQGRPDQPPEVRSLNCWGEAVLATKRKMSSNPKRDRRRASRQGAGALLDRPPPRRGHWRACPVGS